MGRWVLALVVSGLLFGGGLAIGRASERVPEPTSAASEECAVVTLPEATPAATREETPPSTPAPTAAVHEEPAPEAGLPRVRRLVVTSGIEGHEPAEALDEVVLGSGPVYAFVEAANDGGATGLEVTFEPARGGASTGHVELDVPAHVRRYRTWAFTRGIRSEGLWCAVVRDENGRELAREAFDVVGAE